LDKGVETFFLSLADWWRHVTGQSKKYMLAVGLDGYKLVSEPGFE